MASLYEMNCLDVQCGWPVIVLKMLASFSSEWVVQVLYHDKCLLRFEFQLRLFELCDSVLWFILDYHYDML